MTGRGEAKQLRARELQPGCNPSRTQALSRCATQQRQKLSSESDSIPPRSSFPPAQYPLLENKQALSYKSQIAFLFQEGIEERKENKGPSTHNPLYGSISWELHCTKPSNKAVVLIFPEQIEQMMLFISIINIKLYFLHLVLEYISALWM